MSRSLILTPGNGNLPTYCWADKKCDSLLTLWGRVYKKSKSQPCTVSRAGIHSFEIKGDQCSHLNENYSDFGGHMRNAALPLRYVLDLI